MRLGFAKTIFCGKDFAKHSATLLNSDVANGKEGFVENSICSAVFFGEIRAGKNFRKSAILIFFIVCLYSISMANQS